MSDGEEWLGELIEAALSCLCFASTEPANDDCKAVDDKRTRLSFKRWSA